MNELYKESVSEQDYETRCKGETASELLLLKSIREREWAGEGLKVLRGSA